jgi:hypothetical protein
MTDDLGERLRLYELALFELVRNVHSLKHSAEAIRACLIANDSNPEEAKILLDAAEEVTPQLDPNRPFLDQVEAYLEILKSRKNPKKQDT